MILFIVDWANALSNPIAYQSNLEKHTQQLKALTDDFDIKNEENGLTDVAEQVCLIIRIYTASIPPFLVCEVNMMDEPLFRRVRICPYS